MKNIELFTRYAARILIECAEAFPAAWRRNPDRVTGVSKRGPREWSNMPLSGMELHQEARRLGVELQGWAGLPKYPGQAWAVIMCSKTIANLRDENCWTTDRYDEMFKSVYGLTHEELSERFEKLEKDEWRAVANGEEVTNRMQVYDGTEAFLVRIGVIQWGDGSSDAADAMKELVLTPRGYELLFRKVSDSVVQGAAEHVGSTLNSEEHVESGQRTFFDVLPEVGRGAGSKFGEGVVGGALSESVGLFGTFVGSVVRGCVSGSS